MYTKSELITRAKHATEGILSCHLPIISIHFGDFADEIGLDHDKFYHINKYIRDVSYAAKRHIFESIGFKVLHLSLGAHKVSHLANDTKFGKSLDAAFLDGERNAFILDIEQGLDNLYFILEYEVAGDPLADYTIDREQLARELKRKEAAGNWYKSIREKRKNEPKEDFPF